MAPRVPVVIMAFARPKSTAMVLDAVKAARPARVIAVLDGPRPHKPGEDALCAEVAAQFAQSAWPCPVEVIASPVNMGLRARISTGLSEVFSRHDRAIIIEDDCVPHPSFFPFCEELLERYADNPRVSAISGNNFAGTLGGIHRDASYHFTPFPHIWGWATWARVWQSFDADMRWWRGRRELFWLWRCFGDLGLALSWYHTIRNVRNGKIESWALPFTVEQLRAGTMAVGPEQNLVTNVGFGDGATNTTEATHPRSNIPAEAVVFPLKHPDQVAPDQQITRWTQREVFHAQRPVTFGGVRRWLRGR